MGGGGEIAELGESFGAMKRRLDTRLRYISDFAADVAHELKSPLTSIRGAAELLGEGAAEDASARARFLRNIELDVARLDRLVSRLLELSRIDASSEPMTAVDLHALLVRAQGRASLPDQPIVLRYVATTRFIRGREADLETAVLNLLDNAVRYSPPDVAVEVEATGGGSEIDIRVIDHGEGIPLAIQPRIFDRFFTTDQGREGTGLGLSIVVAVIMAHAGHIEVKSRPGERRHVRRFASGWVVAYVGPSTLHEAWAADTAGRAGVATVRDGVLLEGRVVGAPRARDVSRRTGCSPQVDLAERAKAPRRGEPSPRGASMRTSARLARAVPGIPRAARNSKEAAMSTVLVTGGSGFVGSHCVLQLLAAGHQVRATVRNLTREGDVRAMVAQGGADAGDRLSFFAADLEKDEGWADAIVGCEYVLHVASPFPAKIPPSDNALVVPAREGTLRCCALLATPASNAWS